jgi:hypothetical protein
MLAACNELRRVPKRYLCSNKKITMPKRMTITKRVNSQLRPIKKFGDASPGLPFVTAAEELKRGNVQTVHFTASTEALVL